MIELYNAMPITDVLALRVNAARKSIVLSDVRQLPDAFASRLQLD